VGHVRDNKAYQKTKNWLMLVGIILTLFILWSTLAFGLTGRFYVWGSAGVDNQYFSLFLYFLIFSTYSMILSFPLSFYSGFTVEHEYSLSNQLFSAWLGEWFKKQLLSFGIVSVLVIAFYGLVWNFNNAWWFLSWMGYIVFSLVLGKLFPTLIVPLFYKYGDIENHSLKKRIENLASQFGFSIQNVFSINLSKTTKKANAMFTGFGKTRRVVLSDTLLASFTDDEIETVVGHELGHCKHHDVWKRFGFGSAVSLLGFWLAFNALGTLSSQMGFDGAGDVRAFPLLCLIFYGLQLMLFPVGNAFSRHAERRADQFALDATGKRDSFISAFKKLSDLNLADPQPNPILEFLLYDHPSIGKRIQMAEQFSK
jgi:STE24 endopeptidase